MNPDSHNLPDPHPTVSHWRRAFQLSAGFALIGVVLILTFSPQGTIGAACFVLATISGAFATYAASKLRDAERIEAASNATAVGGSHRNLDVGDMVDLDD